MKCLQVLLNSGRGVGRGFSESLLTRQFWCTLTKRVEGDVTQAVEWARPSQGPIFQAGGPVLTSL